MKRIITLAMALTIVFLSSAQEKRTYTTTGGDGGILSFSQIKRNGNSLNSAGRFTLFFNIGTNLHHDFSKHAGIFTGLTLKNIGIIHDDVADQRFKRRVYAAGVPIGLKFGNMEKENFGFIGFQADLALNYKEKLFINGDKKDKFNEWFSNRTNIFMPAVFAGFHTKNDFSLKLQYYFSDFLNTDFTQNNLKPFQGMESKMFFLTLGYDFDLKQIKKKKRNK